MIQKKTRYIDTSGENRNNRVVVRLSDSVLKDFLKQKKKDLFWDNSSFLEHIILKYINEMQDTGKARCRHCGGTISNEIS